jgi:hypothetical protein
MTRRGRTRRTLLKIFDVVDTYELLRHVLAIRCEYLNAFVSAISHIDESVVRHLDIVRVVELLEVFGVRSPRVLWEKLYLVATHSSPRANVLRLVSISAPMPLVLAAVCIEDDDSPVGVSI